MDIASSNMKNIDKIIQNSHEEKSVEFKRIYSRFKELFKVKKDYDLIKLLRSKNSNNKNVCTMSLPNGTPAWICDTCKKDEYSVICMKCFDQGNHKDHKITLRLSVDGCCDCGDPQALKENGFCSEHKGIISSYKDIEAFIVKTFDNDNFLINEIKIIFDQFFQGLSIIIEELEKIMVSKNPSSFNNSSWLISNLVDALENLDIICEANYALRLIAVNYFEKNYSFYTRHICLQFIERNNQVSIEKINLNNDVHPCRCSFLQNLLRIWDKSIETKYDIQTFFFNFLKSYKFKFLYGYCYISLYDILLINDSQQVKNFSFQIMLNEEISISLISSTEFVYYLFNKLNYLVSDFTSNNKKDLKILDDIITEFYLDICYMLKPKPSEIFSKNINYYIMFTEILRLIQYINKVGFCNTFQYEAYNENLIMVEYYLLNIFSLIITIIDIDQTQEYEDIIINLLEKIFKEINKSKKDVFSFHIPLNRALSIVVTRYCFAYAKKKKIDFREAAQIIFRKCYHKLKENLSSKTDHLNLSYNDFFSSILEENLRVIGFINSICCKHWTCYGDNMLYYSNLYYSIGFYDIFYYCDISLIKIILSILEDEEVKVVKYNFTYIFNIMNIFSYNYDLIYENGFKNDKEGLLYEKNFETIIQILLNENILFDTIFNSYEKILNNYNSDKLFDNFCEDDIGYMNEYVKRRLVPQILSKENSVSHSEIIKLLPIWIRENKNIIIDNILDEICKKVNDNNKPIFYKVKEKFFRLTDFFIFKDPTKKKGFIKYMIETCIGPINPIYSRPFFFLEILQEFEFSVFTKVLDLDFINNMVSNLIIRLLSSGKDFSNRYILINFYLKLFDLFSNSLSNHVNQYSSKNKLIDLRSSFYNQSSNYVLKWIDYLDKIKDENLKEGIIYITKKLKEKDYIYTFKVRKGKDLSSTINYLHNQTSKLNLTKNISTNTISEESSDLERSFDEKFGIECCKCKNKINPSEYIISPFCKIAFVSNTSFLYHSNIQSLKSFYDKNNLERTEGFPHFKSFRKGLIKDKDNKSFSTLRVISCGHYIHYECFEATINNVDIDLNEIYFICPECKKISNFIIPFIYSNDSSDQLLKSYSFTDYLKSSNETKNIEDNNEIVINETFVYISSLFLSKIYKVFTKKIFNYDDFVESFNVGQEIVPINIKENKEIDDNIDDKLNIKSMVNNIYTNQSYQEEFMLIFVNLIRNITFLPLDDYLRSPDIIKIYTYILKIYINCNILQSNFFIRRFEKILYYWLDQTFNENIIFWIEDKEYNKNLEIILIECIILYGIIFKEVEMENFIKILLSNYLPVLILRYYVHTIISKNNYIINYNNILNHLEEIEDFHSIIEKEERTLLIFMNPLFLKIIILFLTYKNIDYKLYSFLKSNYINSSEDEKNRFISTSFNFLNLNNLYQECKKTNKDLFLLVKNIYISHLKKSINLIEPIRPSFFLSKYNNHKLSLITLPKTILDMCYKNIKIKCKRCNKNPVYSLICLFCGKKLCYLKECCNKCGEEENLYEFQYHTLKCGYGIGCYITLYSGRILFCLNEKYELTTLSVYQNKFGESVKDKDLTHDYILNEELYSNLLLKLKNLEFLDFFVTE